MYIFLQPHQIPNSICTISKCLQYMYISNTTMMVNCGSADWGDWMWSKLLSSANLHWIPIGDSYSKVKSQQCLGLPSVQWCGQWQLPCQLRHIVPLPVSSEHLVAHRQQKMAEDFHIASAHPLTQTYPTVFYLVATYVHIHSWRNMNHFSAVLWHSAASVRTRSQMRECVHWLELCKWIRAFRS